MIRENHSFIAQATLAVKCGIITLAEAVALGLFVASVVCLCVAGATVQKARHDSHNVKGFRAPLALYLSPNR
jgi:hypothetical protein